MPQIRLTSHTPFAPIPVDEPAGPRLLLPRIQLLCLVRLPNTLMPRDGIIDTGSPFSWFLEDVWRVFRPGIDFEWLPFEAGYSPPRGQTAGWAFTFRMARMLQPITLMDTVTELERNGVIVQFADGNPPSSLTSKRPPRVVLGLWGGVLEGTSLRMTRDAGTGHPLGSLDW
jgi:hypothetical protein